MYMLFRLSCQNAEIKSDKMKQPGPLTLFLKDPPGFDQQKKVTEPNLRKTIFALTIVCIL